MKTTLLTCLVLLVIFLFPEAGQGQSRARDRNSDCNYCDRSYRNQRDYRPLRGPRQINGLRAGLNVSNLRDPDGEKLYPDNLAKYYIAYQRESPFAPLLYYGAGLELSVNGGRDNLRQELNLLYISIPLTMRVDIGPAYARAGFMGSMRLTAQEFENNLQIPLLRNKYRVFDYSFVLGGGVQFLIFFAEMRFSWGQLNVIDEYKNRQFQLGGGIRF